MHLLITLVRLPGDFKNPQKPDTSEHRYSQWGHDLQLHQDGFSYASTHHKAVKPVKEGDKVCLKAKTVHLHQHLTGKTGQQGLIRYIWKTGIW